MFYGSLAYAWNIERDVSDVGKIDPGDSIEYNLGMATALSERASLSFSFQNAFTDKTTLAGEDIADSKLISASLSLGVNYRVSQKYSLFGVINIGLTKDTPDFQVQLNIQFQTFLMGWTESTGFAQKKERLSHRLHMSGIKRTNRMGRSFTVRSVYVHSE